MIPIFMPHVYHTLFIAITISKCALYLHHIASGIHDFFLLSIRSHNVQILQSGQADVGFPRRDLKIKISNHSKFPGIIF